MIELRSLTYFSVACQNESLTRAAEQLGVALSTLSVSLKSLEQELGLELFQRLSSGLYPTAAASWLVRAAVPILHAEAFSRRWLTRSNQAEAHILTLEIDLSFTIGRISKAIDRAAEALAATDPDVLLDPVWIAEKGCVRQLSDSWPGVRRTRVMLSVVGEGGDPADGDITLLLSPWVLACRLPADTTRPPSAVELFAGRRVMVPALRRPLTEQATEYFRARGIRGVQFMSEHPGALPRYMEEHPDAAFFLPESVLSARLGLLRVRAVAPDPPLMARIFARAEPSDPAAVQFIHHLQKALEEPERLSVQRAVLSARQIRCFNAIHRLRRVSAAAHAADMTQPALSEQLHKLETSLDTRLFERHRDGLTPTRLGERFAAVASVIESHLRDISVGGTSTFLPTGKSLMLGILPSVSQHGLLVNKITESLLVVQVRYPSVQLIVREAPDGTLQDWVMRGVVGIAIVDTGLPHMARLALNSSENLAVIANPRLNLLPPGPVRLTDLALLPLALPTTRFGLRQLLETAAQDHNIEIRPRIEIDSLTMLATLLARQPLCTVLPPSAVRPELAAGELVAHPIVEPAIARRLFVIYSGDRSLTEPERSFVHVLREHLADEKDSSRRPICAPQLTSLP